MKRGWLITILVLIVIAVITVGLLYLRGGKSRQVAEQANNILEAQQKGTLSVAGEAAKRDIINSVVGRSETLVTTESMEIGYLAPPEERIMVFILQGNAEAVEEQALNWLMSRGFSQEDICNFPVIFSVVNNKVQTTEPYKLETNYIPPYCQALFD